MKPQTTPQEAAIMERERFETEIRRAKALGDLGTPEQSAYWQGYQRGLRRGYHGAAFGTEAEHQTMLALAGDPQRDARGRGYRDGLTAGGAR